jgi:hypothetical protein
MASNNPRSSPLSSKEDIFKSKMSIKKKKLYNTMNPRIDSKSKNDLSKSVNLSNRAPTVQLTEEDIKKSIYQNENDGENELPGIKEEEKNNKINSEKKQKEENNRKLKEALEKNEEYLRKFDIEDLNHACELIYKELFNNKIDRFFLNFMEIWGLKTMTSCDKNDTPLFSIFKDEEKQIIVFYGLRDNSTMIDADIELDKNNVILKISEDFSIKLKIVKNYTDLSVLIGKKIDLIIGKIYEANEKRIKFLEQINDMIIPGTDIKIERAYFNIAPDEAINNIVDVVFVIDASFSMDSYIDLAKQRTIEIINGLKERMKMWILNLELYFIVIQLIKMVEIIILVT